jgi:hypothetical protein
MKLHNELHNLYASSDIIRMVKLRRMRLAGHGRDEKSVQNFISKPEGKVFKCRWDDNIKMFHK